jgi:DNA-binding beta-propeller fold protein YncE
VSGPARAVYVSNGRGGTVTPIATLTGVPGPPIPIGRTAGDIAITPDGKTAYVTSDDGVVVPIATATAAAGPAIGVGGHTPDGIVITPDGKTVHVAVISTNEVVPIATATRPEHGDADRHGRQRGRSADPGRRRTLRDHDHAGR